MIKYNYLSLIKLAIPNFFVNLSVPLLSLIDIILIGRDSSVSLNALGICGTIFNFLYWNMGFLKMGSTGIIANAYGRSDHLEIKNSFFCTSIIALLLGVLIFTSSFFMMDYILSLFKVSGAILETSRLYFKFRIIDAPAVLYMYCASAWYLGQKKNVEQLKMIFLVAFLNITLSLLLVHLFSMGISGVALGTSLSQYVGCLYFFIKEKGRITGIKISYNEFKYYLKKLFGINIFIFARTLSLSLVFFFINKMGAGLGIIGFGAHTIFMQMTSWISYAQDALATVTEFVIGEEFGRNGKESVSRLVKMLLTLGLGLSFLIILIMFFTESYLFNIYSNQIQIIEFLKDHSFFLYLYTFIGIFAFIFDGVQIGLLETRTMFLSMFSAAIVFFLYFFIFMKTFFSSIWIGLLLFLLTRGIFQFQSLLSKGYLRRV